ncbi:MAG: hypothetical protein FJZ56_02750 [Chlamydiae bacterium]|nr:hypothetical protein [Chlamydiota bacterium]
MIPYLLMIAGGYLISQSLHEKKMTLAKGGSLSDGTIEYDVEIEAINEEDGNKYRFIYDIIANNDEEALDRAKNMFMVDDYGNLTIKAAKIKHEYEFMSNGGVTTEAFLENPTFTFKTIEEHENAKSGGYIDEYDIVRVVMQNDFKTVDFPVHSLEEYNKIKNNENKAKYIVKSYQEKHVYDVQDYYDPEDDTEDYEYERYDDEYDVGGKIKKSKIKKKSTKFVDIANAISKKLQGSKVPARLKKDYGTTYNKKEAEEAARRIAGARLKKIKE